MGIVIRSIHNYYRGLDSRWKCQLSEKRKVCVLWFRELVTCLTPLSNSTSFLIWIQHSRRLFIIILWSYTPTVFEATSNFKCYKSINTSERNIKHFPGNKEQVFWEMLIHLNISKHTLANPKDSNTQEIWEISRVIIRENRNTFVSVYKTGSCSVLGQ